MKRRSEPDRFLEAKIDIGILERLREIRLFKQVFVSSVRDNLTRHLRTIVLSSILFSLILPTTLREFGTHFLE